MRAVGKLALDPYLEEDKPGTVIVREFKTTLEKFRLDATKIHKITGISTRTIQSLLSEKPVRRKSVDDMVSLLYERANIDVDPQQKLAVKSVEPTASDQNTLLDNNNAGGFIRPPKETLEVLSENTELLILELRSAVSRFRTKPGELADIDVRRLQMAKEEMDSLFEQFGQLHELDCAKDRQE